MRKSIMNPSRYAQKGGGGRSYESIIEGMNVIKVHDTHIWNYHYETLLIN
jgi:hypothetical protein